MIFKKIKRFEKDSSVRIFCPLAYGNVEYIKSIVETGTKLLEKAFLTYQVWWNIENI